MNERDNKKQHELWFKNKYPDDYLLFIHDASREALIKYVNSEEVWLASAKIEGYKLVPLQPNNKTIVSIERAVENQIEASGITQDPFRLDGEKIYKAMIGEVDEST